MSRSRLYPYRDAIREALDAGTSLRNLARTYDVDHTTMAEFVGRWLPDAATQGSRNRDANRHDLLQKCQYDTLRRSDLRIKGDV